MIMIISISELFCRLTFPGVFWLNLVSVFRYRFI